MLEYLAQITLLQGYLNATGRGATFVSLQNVSILNINLGLTCVGFTMCIVIWSIALSAMAVMCMSYMQPIHFRGKWGEATLRSWLCKQHHWQSAAWDCPHRRLWLEHHCLRQCARQGWGMWRSMPLTAGLLALPAPTDHVIHRWTWLILSP